MYVSWHFSENLVDILRVMAVAKQMATARFLRWFYLTPVLTSHPVLPDCLLNLLRKFA